MRPLAFLRCERTRARGAAAEHAARRRPRSDDQRHEVLLRLSWAPERRLRRVDLAGQVLLTASGITRLLGGLEQNRLVARESCASDRRVVYAVLTDAGLARVEEATKTHFGQIARPSGSTSTRGSWPPSPVCWEGSTSARLTLSASDPRSATSRGRSFANTGSASGRAAPGTWSRSPPSRTGALRARTAGRTRPGRSSSRDRS